MTDEASRFVSDLPVSPARLLQEAPNGWLLSDRDGIIRFANARAESMFGYTHEELLGHPIEELVPHDLRGGHTAHRDRFWQAPAQRPMGLGMELSALRKDGSVFPVEISLAPVETAQGTYIIAVVRDITERIDLEKERNNLRLELEMERERDRIGMDLHDGILQEIYAAGLTLELALTDVMERPTTALDEVERSIDQLHAVVRNIRSYIFDLRPRQFTGTLSTALHELAREFRQNTQVEVTDEVPEVFPSVDEASADAAYHIVHEALSNVRKHSRASQVTLSAHTDGDALVVEVIDNGCGFDAEVELPQVHRGVRNMRARALRAGCDLVIESVADQGVRISLAIPLSSASG